MEQSTLHIKAPHEIHIGAKVMAAKRSTSMNQYVIDLIKHDLEKNEMPLVDIEQGINLYRSATPKQRNIIQKASVVIDEIVPKISAERLSNGLCKIHGTPLDDRGRCMQKGCKYA